MSDPAKYRTREEVDEVRTHHDPIDMARHRILEKKIANEDELKKIDGEVRDLINAGVRIRHARSRARCRRALDRRVPLRRNDVIRVE